MKIWFGLLLTILSLTTGCAPGYYDTRPAYRQEAPAVKFYQNPETEDERQMRIWREGAGR